MKVKKLLAVLCTVVALALGFAFAACDNDKDPETAAKTYTVTFDANGGELNGNATVKVEENKTISGAPTASKTDYDFSGWYTLATDGDKIDLGTYKVTKDVTLYAHYTEKETPPAPAEKIEITFNANGGKIDGKDTLKVEAGKDGVIPKAPAVTRDGYRLDGWYDAAENGNKVRPLFDKVTENTTLYAHWTREYTVTFDANGGELNGSNTLKVAEGDSINESLVPSVSLTGKDFQGWFTAKTGGEKVNFKDYHVSADVTLYARFGEFSMPIKTLKSADGKTMGYTLEAEDSKFTVTVPEFLQQWLGTNPVETVANASGGKSLGFMTEPGKTVTFTFNAATAGTAKLYLRATSALTSGDNGPVIDATCGSDQIAVSINGTDKTYAGVTVRGSGEASVYNKYWDSVIVGEFSVAEGFNTIVLTVKQQAINLDCIDIETSCVLTSVNGDQATGESTFPAPPAPAVNYEKEVTGKLIITDHAEGPAIYKAVLGFTEDIPATAIAKNPFKVGNVGANTDKVYLSDAEGVKVEDSVTSSRYVTIEYAYSIASSMFGTGPANNVKPFTYNMQTNKNSWNDVTSYKLAIDGLTIGDKTYTKFTGTFTAEYDIPELDKWDTTGSYTDGDITLKYASFAPAEDTAKPDKKPLIIWLHGAGEGGTDPSIVLLGNQVVNLGKPLIQKYFTTDTCAGAYVLAPQSPTMWMDNGDGQQGGSDVGESIYTESLFKLIQKFVTDHTDIDADRIYIGGCSNGGWMTVEMLSKHGEYFAAAYPIAVPFDKGAGLTDEEFERLVNVPMWITHAKADMTVSIGTTRNDYWQPEFKGYTQTNANSLYIELLNAGASNVHYTLFDKVVIADGEDKTPQGAAYDGHYSWIYTLRDECSKVQATTGSGANNAFVLADINENSTETVTVDGSAVTLWGWIAAQAKTPAQA